MKIFFFPEQVITFELVFGLIWLKNKLSYKQSKLEAWVRYQSHDSFDPCRINLQALDFSFIADDNLNYD